MDAAQVTAWIEAYELAWRSPGTGALDRLFTEDATYSQGPYEEPATGLLAIKRMWEAERNGPDEVFSMASQIVAVDSPVAVARVEVRYGDPVTQAYRDLWIMQFAADGRCDSFEEWPFWPGKPHQV
ncbi:MAG TPA: nuclear transport factor 2 family protein [Streptosporangiaceae bacterium]|nr:nuclear transport factor 2 family protein [Streptosporangiaceae bacterium]